MRILVLAALLAASIRHAIDERASGEMKIGARFRRFRGHESVPHAAIRPGS
jgi:hypothetical protein